MTNNSEHFNEMAELLEQSLPPKLPQNGESLQATIVMYSDQGLIVDIGMKMEGIIPKEQMRKMIAKEEKKIVKSLGLKGALTTILALFGITNI